MLWWLRELAFTEQTRKGSSLLETGNDFWCLFHEATRITTTVCFIIMSKICFIIYCYSSFQNIVSTISITNSDRFFTDVKNAFEIVDRDQPKAIFFCKTEEEKTEWMSVLMTIYMRR